MATIIRKREAEPEDYDGGAVKDYRYRVERYVAADGWTPKQRKAVHALRRLAATHPEAAEALRRLKAEGRDLLLGDELDPLPGSTRRGVPPDYTGDDPHLCNARTRSGKPCRAMKLAHGRCKWHGGLSTGPRTPEGKARCTANLPWARKQTS